MEILSTCLRPNKAGAILVSEKKKKKVSHMLWKTYYVPGLILDVEFKYCHENFWKLSGMPLNQKLVQFFMYPPQWTYQKLRYSMVR